MSLFIPKQYQKDIFNIDYDYLKKNNYKIIIFDLDNTIGKVKDKVCDIKTSNFINELNKKFIVIIASNSRKKRVYSFCKELECEKLYFSLKPSLKVLRKIKHKYNINYENMVIVGDQLLTDILLGNRKGLMTILVDKKGEYDLKKTKINRVIEGFIKKKYNLKEGDYYK